MMTVLAAAFFGQVLPFIRAPHDDAKLPSPSSTAAVEAAEHTIGKIEATLSAKQTVWVLPSGLKLDTRKLPDGKSIYFTGAPGSYTLFEVAVNATGEAKTFERSVTIRAAGPTPQPPAPTPPNPLPPAPNPLPTPPAPTPGPQPAPSPPQPGKHGVARVAFDEAMKIALPARAKAKPLAGEFRGVQAAIVAGTIKTQAQLTGALDAGYAAAIGADRPAWTAWQKAVLAKVVAAVNAASLLAKLATAAECLGEAADGLAAVK